MSVYLLGEGDNAISFLYEMRHVIVMIMMMTRVRLSGGLMKERQCGQSIHIISSGVVPLASDVEIVESGNGRNERTTELRRCGPVVPRYLAEYPRQLVLQGKGYCV